MVFQFAKLARNSGVLGIGHVLIAQEQHLVLQQRRFQRPGHIIVGSGFRQIDAADFRTKGAGEALDFHGHSPDVSLLDRV